MTEQTGEAAAAAVQWFRTAQGGRAAYLTPRTCPGWCGLADFVPSFTEQEFCPGCARRKTDECYRRGVANRRLRRLEARR